MNSRSLIIEIFLLSFIWELNVAQRVNSNQTSVTTQSEPEIHANKTDIPSHSNLNNDDALQELPTLTNKIIVKTYNNISKHVKESYGYICFHNVSLVNLKMNQTNCQCVTNQHINLISNCSCKEISTTLFRTWYTFSCSCNGSQFVVRITKKSCHDTSSQIQPKRAGKTTYIVWEIIQYTCNFLILVIGMTGNILIAITIIRIKTMQNLQNYFVFSLALTDLLTIILVMPLNLIKQYISWPFGAFVCSYIFPIADVLPAVSIITLVAISIDRYRAICYALSHTHTLTAGACLILVIWIISYMAVGFPLVFVMKVAPGVWTEASCDAHASMEFMQTYITCRTLLFFAYPSMVIFICYLKVNSVLGKNLKFLARSASGLAQVVRLKRQRRVMSMFFAIFLTFFICFLPMTVLNLFIVYAPTIAMRWEYLSETFQMCTIFAFANSACNPVILYKLSRGYRESFQNYLPFLKSKHGIRKKGSNDTRGTAYSDRLAARRSTKDSNISFLALSPRYVRSGPKEPAIEMDDDQTKLYVPNSPSVRSSFIAQSPLHLF